MRAWSIPIWLEGKNGKKELRQRQEVLHSGGPQMPTRSLEWGCGQWGGGGWEQRLPWGISGTEVCWEGESQGAERPVRRPLQIELVAEAMEKRGSVRARLEGKLSWAPVTTGRAQRQE